MIDMVATGLGQCRDRTLDLAIGQAGTGDLPAGDSHDRPTVPDLLGLDDHDRASGAQYRASEHGAGSRSLPHDGLEILRERSHRRNVEIRGQEEVEGCLAFGVAERGYGDRSEGGEPGRLTRRR